MIDSHCHLEHIQNAEEVIDEARKKMKAIVTSVPDPRNFERMLLLGNKYKGFVFVAAGFHPEHVNDFTDEEIEEYMDLIRVNADRIVSIGEVGLDYFWIKDREKQERTKAIFEKFIDLALLLDKPLTIHSRSGEGGDGISETIEILKKKKAKNAMFHCFSGSEENLKECLEHGWYISFATVIVKSRRHQRLAKDTPMEKMLLDTDAPWLDPDAKPGSRDLTNKPWKIERSAEVIAEAKGITKQEVLRQTEENAKKFFRLEFDEQ
jgi:TatD DNase family protein